ncbi:MAG TPA: hypothetical protein VF628_02375 [Allosphingosinicella sp.]|jgi:hypothetical protein
MSDWRIKTTRNEATARRPTPLEVRLTDGSTLFCWAHRAPWDRVEYYRLATMVEVIEATRPRALDDI